MSDWTRNAGHVVLATVVEERASRSETSPGHTRRRLTIDLVDLVFSNNGAAELPATLSFDTLSGWFRDRSGTAWPTSVAKAPRLEVGQQYLVALRYFEEEQFDQARRPAGWAPLAAHGAMPVHDGVIGIGEFEGVVHDRALTEAQLRGATAVLRRFNNRSVEAFRRALLR